MSITIDSTQRTILKTIYISVLGLNSYLASHELIIAPQSLPLTTAPPHKKPLLIVEASLKSRYFDFKQKKL